MSGVALIHDVLDAQLVDRRQRKIGRADSIALALSDNAPPRVAAILVGGPVRAQRIGRWAVLLSHALRAVGRVRHNGVTRIPFGAVRRIAEAIEVDMDGDGLEVKHVEDWLAEHVICRIPGAGDERDGEERK
ncbi:MAG: hypothetical protein HOQ31_00615 [Gemmatimonadaceae bacterium]|nr:hypothetical protein [Gemmatimonadaceae bacterium]NUO95209.1 hypothetical protein [Gemmatimonadaceae bacterium]NUR34480.1 hypothetical protein [Gemmatimonadaceae bacterium]